MLKIVFKWLRRLYKFSFAILPVLVIRIIRPFILVRFSVLVSDRIGHFAANTELCLCERDAGINVPRGLYLDLYFHGGQICNRQLARMWERVLRIWPSWLLTPISNLNSLIPGGDAHMISPTKNGRDVHNLLDLLPPHLIFLDEEERQGEAGLRELGIPDGAPFVCLNVRDSSYLQKTFPWQSWDYHNHRDCNIQNYILAAQELVERGYYVVRMGAVVKEAMNVDHPMIIDYAAKGLRNDFMDIYLGAKCAFCITNGTGFDSVPYIFRRPIVYVDIVPLGVMSTFSFKFLSTTKKHWLRNKNRFMTFREIFDEGLGVIGHSFRYDAKDVELIESKPEEIAAVVLEMDERLQGTWKTTEEDEELQRLFFNLFSKCRDLHGKNRSRVGADFLRQHKEWLV